LRRPLLHGTAARAAALALTLALGVGLAALTLHLAGPLGHHHRADGRFAGAR
jgi:hypothetical protein